MADLTASKENIEFDRGKTIVLVFLLLDDALAPINATGWKARMQARLDYSDATPLTGWNFTTETTGLEIVQIASTSITVEAGSVVNGVELDKDTIYNLTNVYAIKLTVSDTITAVDLFDTAYYDIEAIDTNNRVYPIKKGKLIAYPEVTK